jgi:hypothetical protein
VVPVYYNGTWIDHAKRGIFLIEMRKAFYSILIIISLSVPAQAQYDDFYYRTAEAFSAFADPNTGLTVFPTLLIPVGGNLEGMGTAYTAVARDSGFLEANPAGSSGLTFGELSFLHHNWIADSQVEGVIYTLRFNDLGIGVGGKFLYLPFTEYDTSGERESKGIISETVGTINVSYNLFSSYRFYGIAVGTNFKLAYRNIPTEIYPGQSALTGMVDFGLLTRLNVLKFYHSRSKNFSLGAVIKNLGFPALGEPLPTIITTGIAYSPLKPLTIAFDFNLPISLNPSVQPAESWHIATGIDVNVTSFLSLQGGFRVKENPQVSVGGTLDLENVSFVANYNLDLSGRLNPLDKFSVEAKLNLGDRGRLALQRKVDELYASGLEAFAQGDYTGAISDWEKALEMNPKFLPAAENLLVARRRLGLQQETFEKQKLGE